MSAEPIGIVEVTSWLDDARHAVDSASATALSMLPDRAVEDGLKAATQLEAQAAALRLAFLAEAERRELAEATAATGTDAWAAALTGTTRAVMSGGLWLARMLDERYDATREAFAAGSINEAQVRVIVHAAERIPDGVDDEARRDAEAALVAKAVDGMDAQRRHAARRMLEVVSAQAADHHEAALLEDEERAAEKETWLTLHDNGDGTSSGRFVIPELHGHILLNALERLSSPRRLSTNRTGHAVVDDSLPGSGSGLSWSERLGQAFIELVEHLPTTGHTSNVATVMVHLDYQHLLDGLGSARLDTGVRISPGEARRLACDGGLIPTVLGGRSEPLDVGRERRLHTVLQRRSLSTTHETCAAEGCGRPFAWCEIHHPHAWATGGSTSLDNAVPFCGHHHRGAHDSRYALWQLPSREIRCVRTRAPSRT